MILVFFSYLVILAVLFPPILKYNHKGATVAFVLMFVVAFTYSILVAADVNLEKLPFFFSNLLRDWGIKYPKLSH